jgi:hypothetical protein
MEGKGKEVDDERREKEGKGRERKGEGTNWQIQSTFSRQEKAINKEPLV